MTPSSPSNFAQPQPVDPAQTALDTEQLSLLSTFHYIVGGLDMLMSCVFVVLIMAGIDQLRTHPNHPHFAHLLMLEGVLAIALGWIISGLLMLSAYCIHQRRARAFTLCLSVINLLIFPFGTLLGISTFVILARGSIKVLYAAKS